MNQGAHGAFGLDARVARRAKPQVTFKLLAIGGLQLTVDERGDECVYRLTVRHGPDSNV